MSSGPGSSDGPPPPRPRSSVAMLVPLTNLTILLGSLLSVWGALAPSYPLLGLGLLLVLSGVALFVLEGRVSRAWVGVKTDRPPAPAPRAPWWKRPRVYPGKWLCTSCGWREDEATTLCPRCGKVLVRLPAPPPTKS